MDSAVSFAVYSISLFLGMLLLLELGRRIAIRARDNGSGKEPAGIAAVEGAVFALFGLLVAFTFSGSVGRFDKHRELIAEETNAIGTAYLAPRSFTQERPTRTAGIICQVHGCTA